MRYGDRVVFNGFSFQVAPGQVIAVTGASGSGKSSLISMVLGMLTPSGGVLSLFGEPVGSYSARQLREIRRDRVGVVFQAGELLLDLSPVENVLVPALLAGVAGEAAHGRARELLAQLGVPTDVARTDRLSGGERQRVAIARALVTDPELVLADEPTASLDRGSRVLVRDALMGLAREHGRAVLIMTHDEELAASADAVVVLGDS